MTQARHHPDPAAPEEKPRFRLPRSLQGQEMISPAQVARAFGVTRQTIYDWIKREKHPFPKPKKFGRRLTRFRRRDIEDWVADAPEVGTLEDLLQDH